MSAVSVIIPCYNYGPYLKSALEGLLRQSFQDFEVRVVNDGSTDDTERIAAAFTERFGGRLHYVYQANRGVSAARNRALKDAAGRYILFLDADDVLDGAALGTFAAYLDAHPEYGMVYSNTEYFDSESGRTLGLNHGKGPLEKTPYTGLCADKLFTEGNFIPTMSSMFRREVFEKVGVFDETIRYGEDYELWMRITSFFSGWLYRPRAVPRAAARFEHDVPRGADGALSYPHRKAHPSVLAALAREAHEGSDRRQMVRGVLRAGAQSRARGAAKTSARVPRTRLAHPSGPVPEQDRAVPADRVPAGGVERGSQASTAENFTGLWLNRK
jgi:glycosyltransferase involved in cell wall biosynthesis